MHPQKDQATDCLSKSLSFFYDVLWFEIKSRSLTLRDCLKDTREFRGFRKPRLTPKVPVQPGSTEAQVLPAWFVRRRQAEARCRFVYVQLLSKYYSYLCQLRSRQKARSHMQNHVLIIKLTL